LRRRVSRRTLAPVLAAASVLVAGACGGGKGGNVVETATPIQHLIVIFNENVSFDHYFGTYPNAANTDGTPFHTAPGTPKVDGLTDDLLTHNPNAYGPQRLGPSQALTCDQNHNYTPEQKAFDGGKMDRFVENTESDKCTGQPILYGAPGLVMDYYDGNTVTALWNLAQRYALSDASFGSTFGPSTPGALELVAGQTHGGIAVDPKTGGRSSPGKVVAAPDRDGVGTDIADVDPAYDDCSDNNHTADESLLSMRGRNIGDLLNAHHVTWGWFQGGFRPTGSSHGYVICGASHQNVGGISVLDYSPHHEPFQYYRSTANPKHLPPSSVSAIGRQDQANHQYDISDFMAALSAGSVPAVSFLKPPEYQDGHAGYSDPLDEQAFLAGIIDAIERSRTWPTTAVVIAYDDSDGWYDHVAPKLANGSSDPATDTAMCGAPGVPRLGGFEDRCGPGPRLPLLVVSPYSRPNYVDHTRTTQSSVLRFIEDNWRTGRLGGGSFDATAGSIEGMFDFGRPRASTVNLDPRTGAVR
jgi:phospholipase C